MTGPIPSELTSWKEIAQRLQVSVRTAQLWEKERGLPVRRVPGKRGRVYLREADLEAWLGSREDGDSPSSNTLHPAPAATPATGTRHPRWMQWSLAVVVVFAIAITWALSTPGPEVGDPAEWAVRGDTLIVSDAMGHELWRAAFPDGLRPEPYEVGGLFAPIFDDIDGDALSEVVFVAYGEDRTRSSELIAYDTDGSVLWRHRPGLIMSTATEAFDDIYRISAVTLLPLPDGTQDVIVSAHHHVFYPNVVSRLSSTGEVRARYWHPGHLGNARHRLQIVDIDGDEASEILMTGVSNARDAGTFVVLDPDRMDGAAAETAPDYQFQQIPPAQELARIFFPRSALTPAADRYTVGSTINPGRSTVTVSVEQALTDDSRGHVLYTFGRDLSLLEVSGGDSFIGSFRALRAEGTIDWTLDQELRRLEAIVMLRPAGPRGAAVSAPGAEGLGEI